LRKPLPSQLSILAMVALGGALGSVLRHALGAVLLGRLDAAFPWGTLAVNVAGCFAIGVLAGWNALAAPLSEGARAFLVVGLLGGFTTFSAFSFDVLSLVQRGQIVVAAVYVAGSVLLSLTAVFAGFGLVRAVA
jgi:CrcB protein